MNILVVKDDKPGHYNQTEGLLLYLKDVYKDIKVEYIEVKIKSKLSRKTLRILLNNFDSFFERKSNLKYLSFFYKKYKLPENIPDLILSTGGNVSNINAWFTKAYGCKNILNGALRGLNETLFTKITTVIDLGYKNQIILDVAPSIITKEKIEEKTELFIQEKNIDKTLEYYSLLIGGDGSGYNYDKDYYKSLVNLVKKISIKKNIKWLITTSRRTTLEIENFFEKELLEYSAYFVSYNKKEEKVLLPFLGISEKIFVTEESSSMISEAISSKKAVFTLSSKYANPDNNYLNILDKFVRNKQIKRIILEDNKDIDLSLIDNDNFLLLKEVNINLKKSLKEGKI